jgi:hypothetical protein
MTAVRVPLSSALRSRGADAEALRSAAWSPACDTITYDDVGQVVSAARRCVCREREETRGPVMGRAGAMLDES